MMRIKKTFFIVCLVILLSNHVLANQGSVVNSASDEVDLKYLYFLSEQNDPRILSAEAMVRRADYREREAFASLLPQVSADARVTRTHYDGGLREDRYTGERFSISLNQVIFDRAIWQGYQRNKALASQQIQDAKERVNVAIADLIQRYFQVLAAEDSLILMDAEIRLVTQNLSRVESLYEKQMASITELLEVSARKDRLLAEKLQIKNSVELARESLSELAGAEVTAPLKRLGDDVSFESLIEVNELEFWQQLALRSNPFLQAKSSEIEANLASYREARAGHLPRISFSLSSQRTNIGFENAASNTTQSEVAAINLQMSLFSGGSVSARSGAAYESIIISEQEFEAVRREVLRETRSAFLNLNSSLTRIQAASTALKSAERARIASERSFGFGLNNSIEVLDRIKEEFSMQRELLSAKYSFILEFTLLKRWTGELGLDDVESINNFFYTDSAE